MAEPLRKPPTPTNAAASRQPAAASPPPQNRKLKKGDLLFAEGENSRAMYFLKSGIIRIFKKKGDSNIEIDTVHSGQILGELAFLDGNPRSASGEALTECELVEISGPTFAAVLTHIPDWLKILLKTVVTRLRTASTRIRQLESASTSFDYSEKDGKRSSHYVYLSALDVLKLSSAVLLVASRNGQSAENGVELRITLLNRYANQIMGIPLAKLTTFLDLLVQTGVMKTIESGATTRFFLEDSDFLESFIFYMNEENLLEPSKRHDISLRGFMIMGLVAKHISLGKLDPQGGMTSINIAEMKKLATPDSGKEPFRMDDFSELVKHGYATNAQILSADEVITQIRPDEFIKSFRLQRVVVTLASINEQKRKGGK